MTPFEPTDEQRDIIGAALVSQCVVACAGSGKTASAVRRIAEIRRQMGASRRYVALLSYSNVAVDTFRREYATLAKDSGPYSDRVLICTVDSFVTTHILAPHASAVMGCDEQPFLVHGHEKFLQGFRLFNGTYPVGVERLQATLSSGNWVFEVSSAYGKSSPIESYIARGVVTKLGKLGAYTHELGRYWAIETLVANTRLNEILARRYPYILVDEAQDVGNVHGALLRMLIDAGSTVSLVGDPNQAIYEFASADGTFLRNFDPGANGLKQPLTQNRRSIKPIVEVSNKISGTAFTSARKLPVRKHGAYLLTYKESEVDKLLPIFSEILESNGYSPDEAALLCRGSTLAQQVGGGGRDTGQGATENFALAAIWRDRHGDIAASFEFALDGVLRLLSAPSATLRSVIVRGARDELSRELRRLVWSFLKIGIPPARLRAKEDWHPALKANLPSLLEEISNRCAIATLPSWKNNVTTKGLGDAPLWDQDLFASSGRLPLVKTVHKAKGESIDAVMYVLNSRDVKNLLDGPLHEEGRIGYVAITRARDLLIVAIPDSTKPPVIAQLQSKGLTLWY